MPKRLSASRLNDFLGCPHHAALWLGDIPPPSEAEDPTLELTRRLGFAHEAEVLDRLERTYGPAVRIPSEGLETDRMARTLEAMAAAEPLIYQGAFFGERWTGFPDFLIRTERLENGAWIYEPEDAKLARSAKAEHLIQLGVYAELLRDGIGRAPERGAIHLGTGDTTRFDLRRTRHMTRRLMARFQTFSVPPTIETRPVRCAACPRCEYQARCESEWRGADSPIFVAGMRADQVIALEAVGVSSLGQLAALDPSRPMGGLGGVAFARLVGQAALQARARTEGGPLVEVLTPEPYRGFQLLPGPEPGDLFFDIEGDPLFPEGLEYLFGLWGPLGPDGADGYRAIWAHDRGEEKAAFECLMDLFAAHLEQHPRARIHHYAQYEVTALKRLAMVHATCEEALDRLLRERRFVDLYAVVRQSLRTSQESLSLKDLEQIYWGGREGEVASGGDSIVAYEQWRETGDTTILEKIERYNEADVVSTARLRDWLESLRPEGADFAPAPGGKANEREKSEKREAEDARRRILADQVRAGASPDVADLLAELLWFHQRSLKPQWWAHFDRKTWSDEDLIDDLDSIGGVTLDPGRPIRPDAKSWIATYRFDPQETKLKATAGVCFAADGKKAGTIVTLDTAKGEVALRRGKGQGDFPPRGSLIPEGPLGLDVLKDGVEAFARRLLAGRGERALIDILERNLPRLSGLESGAAVVAPEVIPGEGAIAAVQRLDASYLVVQGPPGAGKTWTAARMILALLKEGRRVAVSSNAHLAIDLLLTEVAKCAGDFQFRGAKFNRRPQEGFDDPRLDLVSDRDRLSAYQLVGATAHHLARLDELGRFDTLFVDEAGQVALGNLVAMGGCARNIVLVGDQMQLAQPVQGVHPGDSGLSCLDHLMQGRATVPPERGILLDVTHRLRSELCRYISETFYDCRLTPDAATDRRRIDLDGRASLAEAGVEVIEVDHRGCVQSSLQEADVIADLIRSLVGGRFIDKTGEARTITVADILVVAPYNAQVNRLERRLPPDVRVGTVDKFQGQEAPIAILSMATSDGADAPRGAGFLFDRHRLNVAVSRAQCLAVIVRGTNLLEFTPGSIEDLERLEGFARADELSTPRE